LHDVTGLLKKHGCKADDIISISRQEQGKPGTFEVGFTGLTALDRFLKEGGEKLMYRNRTFACVNLGSQSVTIRLHWLPSYIKDDVVTQMCRRFGEVLSVEREKTTCDIFTVETGVRVVKMQLSADEVKCIPHLLSFRCGTRALVSVPGRPPLCLKCMTVGHMRRDCGADTGARRLFAAPVPPTLSEGKAWQRDGTPQPDQVSQPTADVAEVSAPADEAPPTPPTQTEEPVTQMTEPSPPAPADRVTRGEKRQAADDDEVRDSFVHKIPPNKYVSGQKGVPETSNPFDVLGLLSDEDSLPGDLMIDIDM